MSFGQNIKRLRRDADMTQEQLAELLSISPQAVSRWETNSAMPDISLLPALVNIFNVTSDELLGIDVEKNNDKVTELISLADQAMKSREYKKAADILRDGYRQYPRSFPLMAKLAHALLYVYSRRGETNYDDIIYLCNNILSNCTDNTIRYQTLDILGTVYSFTGQNNEMMQVVDQMPPFLFSRELFMLERVGDTDAGLAERQRFLLLIFEKMLLLMKLLPLQRHDDGSPVYSEEDQIRIWKQLVGIVEIIYPDGDYEREAFFAGEACYCLACAYLNRGDTESGIDWFERACNYFVCSNTSDSGAEHTSPVFQGYISDRFTYEEKCNLCRDYVERCCADSIFDGIRNNPRFEAGIARLKQIADKENN